MSKALHTHIREGLISLIQNGSTRKIARMASGEQGVGVMGLDQPITKTSIAFVFTSHPHFLESHERQAGITAISTSPTLYLNQTDESVELIRELETLAGLPEELQWHPDLRTSDEGQQGGEIVWCDDWVESLMDTSSKVDERVRLALIEAIDTQLLDDVATGIDLQLEQIAERRQSEELQYRNR